MLFYDLCRSVIVVSYIYEPIPYSEGIVSPVKETRTNDLIFIIWIYCFQLRCNIYREDRELVQELYLYDQKL